jgi:putative hemolysin
MIEAAIIVLCLLINALLAGAEMAFVAVSKPGLRELVRQGHKKADRHHDGGGVSWCRGGGRG